MKSIFTFTDPRGESLTVGELQNLLRQYPHDMPLAAMWEGVIVGFTEDHFRVTTRSGFREPTLVIDVDQY